VMITPPIEMPEIQFYLLWHKRSDDSNAQKWLRKLICAQADELGGGAAAASHEK